MGQIYCIIVLRKEDWSQDKALLYWEGRFGPKILNYCIERVGLGPTYCIEMGGLGPTYCIEMGGLGPRYCTIALRGKVCAQYTELLYLKGRFVPKILSYCIERRGVRPIYCVIVLGGEVWAQDT